MKKTILIIIILFFLWGGIAYSGFYPVAVVGYTPILARTWRKLERASEKFSGVQAGAPIDFSKSENADKLLEIKKNALTYLIDDAILRKEGRKIVKNLDRDADQVVADAITKGADISQAARAVYGLEFGEFKNLILLPQARQDVVKKALLGSGGTFDQWFLDVRKHSSIHIFFTPFRWDGDLVR